MIHEGVVRAASSFAGATGSALLDNFTDVTNASGTYFWTTAAWNTSAAATMLGDITADNVTQLAIDLYVFLTTTCSNCSGGGQDPPPLFSVYDVPGGGSFRTEWMNYGGASGALGDPVSNWY